jgi:hypothetical protein
VNQESEFKMQRYVHTDVLLTEHVPIETVGREATWCFSCQHRCLRAFGVYTWENGMTNKKNDHLPVHPNLRKSDTFVLQNF